MDAFLLAAAIAGAVSAAVMGGAYLVFSVMVMPALGRLPTANAIAAMQANNVAAINPVFMTALFLHAVASIAVLAGVAFADHDLDAAWAVAGASLYLVGSIGLTVVFNVPRNNALAALAPAAQESDPHWRRYEREWTAANHVRALASIASAVALTLAL